MVHYYVYTYIYVYKATYDTVNRRNEATAFAKNLTFRVNIMFFRIIEYFEIHFANLRDVHTKGRRERNMKYFSKFPV